MDDEQYTQETPDTGETGPSGNAVRVFTHGGKSLRYIPFDFDEASEVLLTAELLVPRGPRDYPRFRRRDWNFARMLGIHPRPGERLIDAWTRAMHEEKWS